MRLNNKKTREKNKKTKEETQRLVSGIKGHY